MLSYHLSYRLRRVEAQAKDFFKTHHKHLVQGPFSITDTSKATRSVAKKKNLVSYCLMSCLMSDEHKHHTICDNFLFKGLALVAFIGKKSGQRGQEEHTTKGHSLGVKPATAAGGL